MEAGGEEHEEAELLPHPEPLVQPVGEARVLGAPGQLDVGRDDAGQVADREHGERVHGEGAVEVLHRDEVEALPVPRAVAPGQSPADLVPETWLVWHHVYGEQKCLFFILYTAFSDLNTITRLTLVNFS